MNLIKLYKQLLKEYGPQEWWPVSQKRSREQALFEICVGAILTQNTAWTNVAKAIENLLAQKLMNPRAILKISSAELGRCIKSSGYWRQKTKKLKIFAKFLIDRYGGSLQKMFSESLPVLRQELLALWGIGPETADSILLYAGHQPVFVIDAYTRRLAAKDGVSFKTYADYQKFFTERLAKISPRAKVKLYQEFHALIVSWGKHRRK